jgi:hypothetical protein
VTTNTLENKNSNIAAFVSKNKDYSSSYPCFTNISLMTNQKGLSFKGKVMEEMGFQPSPFTTNKIQNLDKQRSKMTEHKRKNIYHEKKKSWKLAKKDRNHKQDTTNLYKKGETENFVQKICKGCGCKGSQDGSKNPCSTKSCSCVKDNLPCTSTCKNCKGRCANINGRE